MNSRLHRNIEDVYKIARRHRRKFEAILGARDDPRVEAMAFLVLGIVETFGAPIDLAMNCLTGADESLGVDALVVKVEANSVLEINALQVCYFPGALKSMARVPREQRDRGDRTLKALCSEAPLGRLGLNARFLGIARALRSHVRQSLTVRKRLWTVTNGLPCADEVASTN